VLKSNSTNWYDLSGGHNFYGNITMNSPEYTNRQITAGVLNLSPITGLPVETGSQIYQDSSAMTFDNNINTTSNNIPCYLFACNNLGDSSKKTTPLSFNSSLFTIDLSNSLSSTSIDLSTSIVKYQACNISNHETQIGHNFYGNCYFNNAISFTNDKPKTYNIPNTLGYIKSVSDLNKDSFDNTLWNITEDLSANSSYLMIGSINLNYQKDQGDSVVLKTVALNLYDENSFEANHFITTISLGQLTFYQNEEYTFQFSWTISGISKIYFNITTSTNNNNVGTWHYIGLSNVKFIRLS
jgi:hypothetical protein